MSLAWVNIQTALQSWLSTASGISSGSVGWAKQPGSVQPPMPYATLRITRVKTLGFDDEQQLEYDGTRPNGQEIRRSTIGQREFVLELHAYSASTIGADAAAAVLSDAVDSLGLLENVYAFETAGFCVFDWGDVLDVSGVLETAFQGHATVEINCRTLSSVEEYFGYIASIGLVDDVTEPDGSPIPE